MVKDSVGSTWLVDSSPAVAAVVTRTDAPVATPAASASVESPLKLSSNILDLTQASTRQGSPDPVPGMGRLSDSKVMQVDASRFLMTDVQNTYFRNLPLDQLDRLNTDGLLSARRAYKLELFGEAIRLLEINPELADVPSCASAQDAESGKCALTAAQLQEILARQLISAPSSGQIFSGHLPQIQRKRALVIGLNQYDDKRIPQLISAVPDARALGDVFNADMGYDVTRLENPSKAQVVQAFNRIAQQLGPNDSLVVYFAGHGEMVDKTQLGYWIPSDANASDPTGWISNADVSRWIANIQAKQVAVVSDSCYSGTFAAELSLEDGKATGLDPALVLNKRSVTVLTSGSDEPVADTGKSGHSVFAWNLMQEIKKLDKWTAGGNVFAQVKQAVESDLPQTPRYGAALSAGHQSGGEFLFERRSKLK
ncbi:MAG TPA: caspase family protein [Burkholderiaceae bacterium]|nr:caspase family protein [Burkholderiaceae bacterium]